MQKRIPPNRQRFHHHQRVILLQALRHHRTRWRLFIRHLLGLHHLAHLQQPLHLVLRLQATHLCIRHLLDLQATTHHQVIQCLHLADTLERRLGTGHHPRHMDIHHILMDIHLLQSLAMDHHLLTAMGQCLVQREVLFSTPVGQAAAGVEVGGEAKAGAGAGSG